MLKKKTVQAPELAELSAILGLLSYRRVLLVVEGNDVFLFSPYEIPDELEQAIGRIKDGLVGYLKQTIALSRSGRVGEKCQ